MTATITGPSPDLVCATLFVHGLRRIDDQTMALARIDHDEPHYADKAARVLRDVDENCYTSRTTRVSTSTKTPASSKLRQRRPTSPFHEDDLPHHER
ncbi:hypothetical protein ACFWWA_36660 [Streptomyces goshikiensis]|uniref:hypothetical protein n=1 Tax=Streptomyces goshikiensis TaxID=1942 RepID=UPI003659F35A